MELILSIINLIIYKVIIKLLKLIEAQGVIMAENKCNIHVGPTSTAQWYDLIQEVTLSKNIKLHEEIESYLIFLLMRFTAQIEIADKIVAIDYLQGLTENKQGLVRRQKLRDVGDTCLIFSGLFPEITEKRLVDIAYYIKIGRNAYMEISQTSNQNNFKGLKELYSSLANDFIKLMDILNNLRETDSIFKSKIDAVDILNQFQDDSLIDICDLNNKIILHSPKQVQ